MWQVQQFGQARSVALCLAVWVLILVLCNFLTHYPSNDFSVSPAAYSPRYRLLWGESSRSVLHLNEDGEHVLVLACKWACTFEENAMRHFCRNKLSALFDLPIRTFRAVIFSSSWGRHCRSSHLQASWAGTADQVSYSWKLLLTTDTAAV